VEARSQVPGWRTPGRRKPGKDRPPDERETARPRGTDPPDAETLEAAAQAAVDFALARGPVAREKRQGGQRPSRGGSGYGRGKTFEGESPRALPA
jgi:hypothetical protein